MAVKCIIDHTMVKLVLDQLPVTEGQLVGRESEMMKQSLFSLSNSSCNSWMAFSTTGVC